MRNSRRSRLIPSSCHTTDFGTSTCHHMVSRITKNLHDHVGFNEVMRPFLRGSPSGHRAIRQLGVIYDILQYDSLLSLLIYLFYLARLLRSVFRWLMVSG